MTSVQGVRGVGGGALRLRLVSLAVCLVTVRLVASLPAHAELADESSVEPARDEEPRATWLETRNLESNFKQLVYLSLQELASEGRLDPGVLAERLRDKRGRHQGFCFKKAKSGRFLPYICWKGENERDDK